MMSFPIHFLPLSLIYTISIGLIYIIYLAKNHDETYAGPAQSSKEYTPIVYVTVATMCLYYIFLLNQSYTAFHEFHQAKQAYREKKTEEKPSMLKIKYGSDNYNVHVANRTAGNLFEQLIPFIVSLYLYATFVSVSGAAKYGWAWVFFRSYYGLAYKRPFPTLFLSTIPAYICVWGMVGGTVYTLSKQ